MNASRKKCTSQESATRGQIFNTQNTEFIYVYTHTHICVYVRIQYTLKKEKKNIYYFVNVPKSKNPTAKVNLEPITIIISAADNH